MQHEDCRCCMVSSTGSFPHPVTVLKGGFIKGLVELILPIVVKETVRGKSPKVLWADAKAKPHHIVVST